MHINRPPYIGASRQLVISMDIGTTYSGCSYCILDPDVVPRIQGVTRFPAQENSGGDSKIPSVMYYDQQGKVKAAGAEALTGSMSEMAENEGWILIQWWKLLLAPKSVIAGVKEFPSPILPKNKTIVDVFADFLQYLLRCTRQCIIETQANGEAVWNSVSPHIKFVLTHPNGYEGAQQETMKLAAIRGGLIPNSDAGRSRITFVTEGEASFNYCATSNLSADAFKENQRILVIDAGGGTVDISAYSVTSSSPLTVGEIFSPECLLQGSEFVTFRARDYIQEKLRSSKFDTDEDLCNIIDRFDASAKRIFSDAEETLAVRFGSFRDNDAARGITRGQLKLKGFEVASFFKGCIDAIYSTIIRYLGLINGGKTNVFLVGGFAASPWLFLTLQQKFANIGLPLSRPDGHTSKAVADGAISFYLDQFVTARIARWTYGTMCRIPYNISDREHMSRKANRVTAASGDVMITGSYKVILKRDTKVAAVTEYSSDFYVTTKKPTSLDKLVSTITCYKGSRKGTPLWADVEPQNFITLCKVEADTSKVPKFPLTG